MSSKRYTDEFKIEATRQVIDRGVKVAEVAERLSVTTHSPYTWLHKFRKSGAVRRAEVDQSALPGGAVPSYANASNSFIM